MQTRGADVMNSFYKTIFITSLIGWLSDRQRRQQKELVKGERETSLAKAASTISFEIKEVLQSLEKIHSRASGLKDPDEGPGVATESLAK